MRELNRYQNQGFIAFFEKKDIVHCPYTWEIALHKDWCFGWRIAKEVTPAELQRYNFRYNTNYNKFMQNFERSHDVIGESLFFRHTCDKLEIGIFPTIFGYRIRVGYINDQVYMLDYCAGANQKHVEEIYSRVLHILRYQETIDLSVFPYFKVKPIHNDKECIDKLRELSQGAEMLTIPDVTIYKQIQLKYLYP